MTNLLSKVPKRTQPWVATMIRTIYQQPSPEEVHAQHQRVVAQLEERFPEGADILAFTAFPVAHWKQVWSNNPQERLNKEIRRRTDVVGIFPNRAAVQRLVGAVLAEQHDEWQTPQQLATECDLTLRVVDCSRKEWVSQPMGRTLSPVTKPARTPTPAPPLPRHHSGAGPGTPAPNAHDPRQRWP